MSKETPKTLFCDMRLKQRVDGRYLHAPGNQRSQNNGENPI